MNEEVLELIKKNNYTMSVHVDDIGRVILKVPNRVLEPTITAYDVIYQIGKDCVSYLSDEEEGVIELECPQYACRILLLMDIKRHCDVLNFAPELLEIFHGTDKIDEESLFVKVWPKNVEYTDELRRDEYNLKDLIHRAQNAVIPFHHDFYFEAEQMGVLPGYLTIRSLFVLGEENE